MMRIALPFIVVVMTAAWTPSTRVAAAEPALIPAPLQLTASAAPAVELADGVAVLMTGGIQPADPGLAAVAERLSDGLVQFAGIHAHVAAAAQAPASNDAGIVLRLDPALVLPGAEWAAEEGYRLVADGRRIELAARTPHGLFNGCQTLLQLITVASDGHGLLPALTVLDAPRFRWRGLMLDCGRHFFTVAEVCRFIDEMALYKFNSFHWHLTEDQGWRIEVKAYPKLTSIGAWRAESPVMGDAKHGDGRAYGGFYTQDDIRTVVAHAAARFITVVPEFEMPGHSTAAIAAYPELGNRDVPGWSPPAVASRWGVISHTLAPREETFRFLETVLAEVLPLFPGPYVHIGGDEAPKTEWHASPFAQQLMQEQHVADEHQLQSWFVKRIEGVLKAKGKRLIGWDEIQEGGLSPTATMMVWRSWKWATSALEQGNDIVMAPTTHTYFDYGQGANPGGSPYQTIGGALALEKVYAFEPIPMGTAPERTGHVLGCQGQLWSEYIWSMPKLEYMAWPRACALSEVAWSAVEARDWVAFSRRLAGQRALFERLHINARRDDGSPACPEQSMALTAHDPPPR
jgi:hexosaminidase